MQVHTKKHTPARVKFAVIWVGQKTSEEEVEDGEKGVVWGPPCTLARGDVAVLAGDLANVGRRLLVAAATVLVPG